MRRFVSWAGVVGLVGLAACDVPLAPKWTVDITFPVDFPAVAVADYAVAGQIPSGSISFNGPVTTQDVQGATDQVLSEDLKSLHAEIVLVNDVQISGQIVISVASASGNLFSTYPGLALTDTITVRPTAGDTSYVTADLGLFQNAQTLYFQTKGTIASTSPSGTSVGPTDSLQVRMNLFATVQLSK